MYSWTFSIDDHVTRHSNCFNAFHLLLDMPTPATALSKSLQTRNATHVTSGPAVHSHTLGHTPTTPWRVGAASSHFFTILTHFSLQQHFATRNPLELTRKSPLDSYCRPAIRRVTGQLSHGKSLRLFGHSFLADLQILSLEDLTGSLSGHSVLRH